MSSKPNARFTINVLGESEPRSLFSVYERANGEITIGLTSPYYATPDLTPLDKKKTYSKVKEHRYSIHPSHASMQGVNTIKQTMITEGGVPVHSYHLTKAIKQGSRFANLFCRQCSNLLHPSAISKTNGKTQINLGEFDPSAFTLFYNVLAGPIDNEFVTLNVLNLHNINVKSHICKNLRITVLWLFTNIPAPNSFQTVHRLTSDPKTEADEEEMLGGDISRISILFVASVQRLTKQILDVLRGEPGEEQANFLADVRGLFSIGLKTNPAFQAHMRGVGRLRENREAARKAQKDQVQGKLP
jgi:hypothetical protein